MSNQESPNRLWERYVFTAREYRASRRRLFDALRRYEGTASPGADPLIEMFQRALADPDSEQDALEAAFYLPLACRQALFRELVLSALMWNPNNGRNYAVVVLRELPGEWVRAHYRPFVDHLLAEDPTRLDTSLLELSEDLDPELGMRLAKRALASDDAYLQDIGAHFTKRFRDTADRAGAS